MKKATLAAISALALVTPALSQNEPEKALSPADIVNAAPQDDWSVIAPEDLMVMTLAPDAQDEKRQVVIQLMPAPFSQGWVDNIRTLARAQWYDGTSVNRVQDNYVVQWGDPNYDNPESGGKAKPLPDGLQVMSEGAYTATIPGWGMRRAARSVAAPATVLSDSYAQAAEFFKGWPIAIDSAPERAWPVHCYGMVGVGRNYSPDTGSGAELYTVIGHAPRHLDRNIALAGRIISGMQHLSSLPRGTGALGFYAAEEADKRTPILSIRVASDLPEAERPQFEYLSTESESFARYADARANRRDPFFIAPAGGADVCNVPVPVRPFEYADE